MEAENSYDFLHSFTHNSVGVLAQLICLVQHSTTNQVKQIFCRKAGPVLGYMATRTLDTKSRHRRQSPRSSQHPLTKCAGKPTFGAVVHQIIDRPEKPEVHVRTDQLSVAARAFPERGGGWRGEKGPFVALTRKDVDY